jgi:hypothetical protein
LWSYEVGRRGERQLLGVFAGRKGTIIVNCLWKNFLNENMGKRKDGVSISWLWHSKTERVESGGLTQWECLCWHQCGTYYMKGKKVIKARWKC